MTTSRIKHFVGRLRDSGPIDRVIRGGVAVLWTVDPQYRYRFRLQTWRHAFQNRLQYVAPPDPYRQITVKPATVTDKLTRPDTGVRRRSEGVRAWALGQIEAGDWDREDNRTPVADHHIIAPVERHFRADVPWEETTYRDWVSSWAGDRYEELGYESFEALFAARCAKYDALFQAIKRDGYQPNAQGPHLAPRLGQPVRSQLEVLVAIDRDGEVLFVDGHHRFAIARVLELTIPVQVVWRHADWQQTRDAIAQDGLSEEHEPALRDHPDLQDILE